MNNSNQPALLVNLAGAHLPPVALSVPAQFQFCVDAGAVAAVGFFDDLTTLGLHDHVAAAMHVFFRSVRSVTVDEPDLVPAFVQSCTDAFAAGYLGRIQQELRLFHRKNSTAASPYARAVH